MKIYTYYQPIGGFPQEREEKLIDLWKKNWSSYGWDPVVITEEDAKKHPKYEDFKKAISELPTVNGHEYEDACYLRWLAVAALGGGWMSDYDVMNYGLDPREPSHIVKVHSLVVHWCVPCLVSGTKEAFEKVVDAFMAHKVTHLDSIFGRPHCSDQFILTYEQHLKYFELDWVCAEYLRDNWKDYPCIHYPNGVMSPNGLMPKHEHIPNCRPMVPDPLRDRKDLLVYFNSLELKGIGVEVGVAAGEFSELICKIWKGERVISIDPWKKYDEFHDLINTNNFDMLYETAKERLSKYPQSKIMRKFSEEASTSFGEETLDFVYIDGNHAYDFVKKDLALWWPKIKKGGFLCGHDYYNAETESTIIEVKKAIDEFISENPGLELIVMLGDYSWAIRKK